MGLTEKAKSLLYAIPFGMKAADSEIMGSGDSHEGEGTSVTQKVEKHSALMSMLRGEVTPEVEALRYSLYQVDRKANDYKYIGNGQVVKKEVSEEKKEERKQGKIRFRQDNKMIVNDILTELKRVGTYGDYEKYTLKLEYSSLPRIRMEKFIDSVDVEIKGNDIKTTFNIYSQSTTREFGFKPFEIGLSKMLECFGKNDSYGIERFIKDYDITTLHFVTFRATNDEPDMISYGFMFPILEKAEEVDGLYKLTYSWRQYVRDDLTEKFFNKSMADKYEKKEKRDDKVSMSIEGEKGKVYCTKCGKELNFMDEGFMVNFDRNGDFVCVDCLNKSLQEEDKG